MVNNKKAAYAAFLLLTINQLLVSFAKALFFNRLSSDLIKSQKVRQNLEGLLIVGMMIPILNFRLEWNGFNTILVSSLDLKL